MYTKMELRSYTAEIENESHTAQNKLAVLNSRKSN